MSSPIAAWVVRRFFADIVREQEPRRRLVLMSGNAQVDARAGYGRRVVLILASPGSTPQSVQDLQPSVGSNRFAVLADDDQDVDIVTEAPPAPGSMASGERIVARGGGWC